MLCSFHSSLLLHPHLTGKGAFKHNKEVMPGVAISTSKEEMRQGRGCSVPEGVGPDAGYGEGRPWRKEPGAPSQGGLCTEELPSKHNSWEGLATVTEPAHAALPGFTGLITGLWS